METKIGFSRPGPDGFAISMAAFCALAEVQAKMKAARIQVPRKTLCLLPIPKGRLPAQGCEGRATLGSIALENQPRRGCVLKCLALGRNRFGAEVHPVGNSQGSAFLATLGFEAESLRDSLAV